MPAPVSCPSYTTVYLPHEQDRFVLPLCTSPQRHRAARKYASTAVDLTVRLLILSVVRVVHVYIRLRICPPRSSSACSPCPIGDRFLSPTAFFFLATAGTGECTGGTC
ncbi:hypothetical protein PC116_g13163 [Phytophthora cactorum]|uniref:Uncharacterized protein n=1 Tax=Phytophthora cactorum TaxID=29920 RepID=A0A8T1KTB5_9STRA|nr:hypothetical protein Pcac1_g11379 [Phytophthora cactorum]KAG2908183.1 hypothetical protein PC114_g10561 [Phytophthora cactorum]KAG2955005.1 hypothetical protein PC117_g759 [Phytophthora cactorum]KAG3020386.1 hypothetical protein PC119_g10000 [Phytophthora cactorum]KAG3169140.1 hypothetical protein C6341_g11173 [Phytophthora cactorum]